jgi:hypothetical protein
VPDVPSFKSGVSGKAIKNGEVEEDGILPGKD